MATILRSSKYVRNFAEFVTKVSFSHVKYDARVNLISPKHFAPSTFVRSLATQVAAKQYDNESNLEITLRRLDADVKRYGRISRTKLKRILQAFENSKSVTSTQALMVIRCCGNLVPDEMPESRSELVNQVWKNLENSGVQLDLSHYNALLRVYVENEYAFSPTEVLAELERKGIEPNKLTYQRLINRYCQQGDIEGASKILEFMREKGISVNENIFTALVRGHSEANDMVSAADILSVMRQAGLEPSADTYRELLCGYAKHGDIQSIATTLTECESKSIHLLDTDFLDVIFSLASNGHGAHVESILAKLPKEVGYLQDALSNILKLVNAGQTDVAMQVLSSIPNRDKGQSGTAVIKQLVKADLPTAKILELCKEIESKGINSRALLLALEASLSKGDVEGSLAFMQTLQDSNVEIREHYFWPVLVGLGRSENNTGIDNLLRSMKADYKITISGETLRDYVIPNKTGGPDEILAELLLVGIPSGSIAYAIVYNMVYQLKLQEAADFATQHVFRYNASMFSRPLVTALGHTGDVKSFMTILRHIYQNRFNARTIGNQEVAVDNKILEPYIIDIATFITEEKPELLTRVLGELLAEGYSISNSCAMSLQRILGNRFTPELAKLINRFKSKSSAYVPLTTIDLASCRSEISRLEESVDRFSGNEEIGVGIKKRLLYLYGRVRDLPNIEKLVLELKGQGVEFTDTMYRQLLDAYINSDVLDKTDEYLTILQQTNPGYQLDDTRLIKYITLLVKNDRIEDAVQYLQNQQNIEVRDTNKNRNIWWRLLNSLAELGNPKAVNTVFDMLLQNEYIEISTPNLGALIKVHIVRDDLTEALNVFEKICETYQHTPLKNELTKKLIQTEDASALQRLTDLSTQVHGESNSLYELAQSFIECNCLRQAKKILQIPALHSKFRRLILASIRYKEQGMTIHLERLVSVIKDVPPFKAIPEFYENLLFCYEKDNNWESALNLKQQLEDEEIEPSDIFFVALADLLKRNNQPVTFTVPTLKRGGNIPTQTQSQSSRLPRGSTTRQQPSRETDDGETDNSERQHIPRAKEESVFIESFIQNGKLNEALEITESLIERNLYPFHRTFRYLIRKASQAGEIGFFERIRKTLPWNLKKSVNFDNNLCHAYVTAGKAEEYFDQLEKHLEAGTESDSETSFAEFPMVGVRSILQKHPEFIERYTNMAEKLAARGKTLPINALWIHYFLNEHPEADKIWSEYLVNSPKVLFNTILRIAQRDINAILLRRLIKVLETAPLVDAHSKGHVYSELIKLCYTNGEYQESVDVLRDALKVVSFDNLQPNTITQMKEYLASRGLALPTDLFPESEAAETKERLTL